MLPAATPLAPSPAQIWSLASDPFFSICSEPARLCVHRRHHDPTTAQDAGRPSQESTTRHESKLWQVEGTDQCGESGGRFDLPEVSWTSISSFKREIAGLTSGSFALALTANSHGSMVGGRRLRPSLLIFSSPFHHAQNHHSHGHRAPTWK